MWRSTQPEFQNPHSLRPRALVSSGASSAAHGAAAQDPARRQRARGPGTLERSRGFESSSFEPAATAVGPPGVPTFLSYEPRTARGSCSCSLERAGIFTTGPPCHGTLAPAVTATRPVTHQHNLKLKLAAGEHLAASLKVPPPKEKTVKTEVASQRKIAQWEEAGMTLRLSLRPT